MLRPSPRRLCSVMTLLMGQAEPRASAIRTSTQTATKTKVSG